MLKRLLAKPLAESLVESLVQSELADVLQLCSPEKVFLFGSAARGEMTDASDLDLLIVLRDDADIKMIKRQYYCRKKLHMVPVDIIFMLISDFIKRAEIGGIAMVCKQEGRVLFEVKP